MMPKSLLRNGWSEWHILSAFVLAVLAVWVTADAWLDILQIARRDEESSHIFLVAPVFAWLVWVRRARLRQCQRVGRSAGPAIAAVGCLVSAIGYHNAIQSFWHGGALLVVLGCVISVVGLDVVRRFFPAVVVLGFLIPVPGMARQQIAIPLQTYTAQATEVVFQTMGMDVARTGNMLIYQGEEIGIAEACNGLRMVFALLLVGYAFCFSIPLRGYVRAIILLLSPVSAILCNLVRLVPTVWLYGLEQDVPIVRFLTRLHDLAVKYFGYEPSPTNPGAHFFHDIAGWAMLAVAFLLLVGTISLLRWALVPVTRYTLAHE